MFFEKIRVSLGNVDQIERILKYIRNKIHPVHYYTW